MSSNGYSSLTLTLIATLTLTLITTLTLTLIATLTLTLTLIATLTHYAAIIPKEDDFLEFECPHFIELGDSRRFLNIEVSRPMVRIKNLVHTSWQTASTSLESRVVISAREVFDVFCEYGETTCHPAENGSYVICIRDTCNVHIDNYYGLHGWGFQGHHGIKGLYGNRNTFNRVDFHSFGYDVFFKDLTVKGRQINLQGGNEWSIEKLRLYITRTSGDAVEYFLNYAIGMRQDYASDCDGILNIDGVTVMWDRGLPGATLYFLGTNARTAQSYHGNLYLDEYFWIPKFQELRKVASGMAIHKKWRQTYFSTPSSLTHSAYPFWSGALFNRGRNKADKVDIDLSHSNLAPGLLCADGQYRQIVTVEDAVRGGCNLFDLDQLRMEYSPDEYQNLLMCEFVDDLASVFPLSELQACMVDSWEVWTDFHALALRPFGWREVWIGYDPAKGTQNGDSAGCVVVAPPAVPGGKFGLTP